jgi:hypothetical protein
MLQSGMQVARGGEWCYGSLMVFFMFSVHTTLFDLVIVMHAIVTYSGSKVFGSLLVIDKGRQYFVSLFIQS